MAFRYINDILHEITKVYQGTCDKCGGGICVGWMIRHQSMTKTEPTTTYCYACTQNQWMKALSIHKQMTHNAVISGKPPREEL